MYGIFTYIYHKNQPNVGKYTIHGSLGHIWWVFKKIVFDDQKTCMPLHLQRVRTSSDSFITVKVKVSWSHFRKGKTYLDVRLEVSKWLGSMGYNLLIAGVYWGYNPLILSTYYLPTGHPSMTNNFTSISWKKLSTSHRYHAMDFGPWFCR